MPSSPSLLTQISSGLRQKLDTATAGFARLAIRLLLRVLHASNCRIDNGVLVLCGWIVLAGSRRERERSAVDLGCCALGSDAWRSVRSRPHIALSGGAARHPRR